MSRRYHRDGAPPDATEFCPQCYQDLPLVQFISSDGKRFTRWCRSCLEHYRNWESLSPSQRAARMRTKPRTGDGYSVALVRESGNRKTGPIPVSMTGMQSCPPSCVFRDRGCYAEFGKSRGHWESVPERGSSWREFCAAIAALPEGTLWRHNEAGDLPGAGGDGEELDVAALAMLVRANVGRRGFTFTHRRLQRAEERAAVRAANDAGFAVNLSANGLQHADDLADLEIGPVAAVVPEDAWLADARTPRGRKVVACLYESDGRTCAECKLCAQPQRRSIIAFRAHGQASAIVSQIVRSKRKEVARAG